MHAAQQYLALAATLLWRDHVVKRTEQQGQEQIQHQEVTENQHQNVDDKAALAKQFHGFPR